MSATVYKLFRPGDVVTDIREVGPGTDTQVLKLHSNAVVSSYGGQEVVLDRNKNPIYPAPHCSNKGCGKPAYCRDSQGRLYLWHDDDPRGCHCPPNPIGDGSDGGPIMPRTPEDRRVVALERIAALLECYLKANGVDLPGEKPSVAPAAQPVPARKTA